MDIFEIERVASLAKLQLDAQEIAHFENDLNKILQFVDVLHAANTSDVAPLAHPLEITQRFRADEVTEGSQVGAMLSNAPRQAQDLFLVPKVIEQ